MKNRLLFRSRLRLTWLLMGSVLASMAGFTPAPAAEDADQLVQQALQAEANGETEHRNRLLNQALKTAANHSETRWQLGHVHVDGEWISLEESQTAASANRALAEYRELRDAYGGTLQGQVMLARFCRKHRMKDRENLHWTYVLQANPGHVEAIRAMNLKPFQGRLMTDQQIEDYAEWLEQDKSERQEWTARIRKIKEDLNSSSEKRVQAALNDISAFRDPAAIRYLESLLGGQRCEWDLAIVSALSEIDGQAASMLLARFAVLSEFPDARNSAIARLKSRWLFDYVPMLMGSMATPIELSFSVANLSDGMLACYNVQQERPTALLSYQLTSTVRSTGPPRGGRATAIQGNIQRRRNQAMFTAAGLQQSILQTNQQAAWLNARIQHVLSAVTGVNNDGRPESWWRWWQDYNDLDYDKEGKHKEYHEEFVLVNMLSCECFLPGTPVWTETGTLPIEKIRVGDRVLSQNVDSGELAYQFVLQTTVRPGAATKRIRVEGEDIYATNGHPMWVNGEGWKMARNLKPGMRMHSPTGSKPIVEVVDGPTSRVHNLVVAGSNSYFVGNVQVLAHDNTVRRPTSAIVPGLNGERASSE